MRPILTLASLTVSAVLYAPFLGLSDALASEPAPWSGWTYTAPTGGDALDSGPETGADGMAAAVWSLTDAGVLADGAPVHVPASLT